MYESPRGALLCKLPGSRFWSPERRAQDGIVLALCILATLNVVTDPSQRFHPIWWIYVIGCLAIVFVRRSVLIYENGIRFPHTGFIPWRLVARSYWDGDVLTIIPASSALTGGGIGRPLSPGAVRIPSEKRPEIERLLPHPA